MQCCLLLTQSKEASSIETDWCWNEVEYKVTDKEKLFFGFTKTLSKMTSDRLNKVENTDDAMALSAIDLSNSVSLTENVSLRNNLQKNIGELTTTSNKLSVAQLRR